MIVIAHTKTKSVGLVAMLALITMGTTATSHAAPPASLSAVKDTYIQSSSTVGNQNSVTNYGLAATVQLKNATGNTNSGDNNRKTYLGYDLGAISPATVTSATLSLTVATNTGVGNNTNNLPYTFHVYGLVDAQDSWGETTLTWNNASAFGNDTASASGMIGAVDLGTFTFNGWGGAPGTPITFTSAALTSLVQSDTNGKISVVITRDTVEYQPPTYPTLGKNSNTLVQNFTTKESGNASQLIVNTVAAVPEAGALTLIAPALGLLGMGAGIRKFRKS